MHGGTQPEGVEDDQMSIYFSMETLIEPAQYWQLF